MSTDGVAGTTSCVPNNFLYIQLEIESSVGMALASTQALPPSFGRQRIGNTIAVDGIGSPGRVEYIDCWFEKERSGWERRV